MKRIHIELSEMLIEIVTSLLLFGAGYGIYRLFGGEEAVLSLDPDTLILIGFVAAAPVGLLIFLTVRMIRRRRRRTDGAADLTCESEEQSE